jgi:hypothetical protein
MFLRLWRGYTAVYYYVFMGAQVAAYAFFLLFAAGGITLDSSISIISLALSMNNAASRFCTLA